MKKSSDEICATPQKITVSTTPSTMPIYPAAVYECETVSQASELLGGKTEGFIYQRDGHPNASALAEQCRELQGGDELGVHFAQVTSTGMSSLTLALVSHLNSGDHVLLSQQLYGRTVRLVKEELSRWGLEYSEVDMSDLEKTQSAIRSNTRMLIVETIANPLLHVADLSSLSSIAHANNAILLVDNTFATPLITRPMAFGADLVMESMSKLLNGHGDVILGLLCGKSFLADRVQDATSSWGLTASPFDCWLASRGMATAHLRLDRAAKNAHALAEWLSEQSIVRTVYYPGLKSHPTFEMARQVLGTTCFGSMVSIEFNGGLPAVNQFIARSKNIRFCPSLGEIATTVSHPRSTSHKNMPAETARKMGITDGLLRISCGVESFDYLKHEFKAIFSAMD
ncbi:MAG: aminotransferase class I/II-fold pyridoxal phosphate-dependent enzyme [Planctomycetota bacterium]|nr:aminotransferase class I/II-fold pyridoxal phosphate-dependent enzyme [Planctomycetota bacterium]